LDQTEIDGYPARRGVREPLLNAPWPILALSLGLIGLYAVQKYGLAMSDADIKRVALSAPALEAGAWQGLFISLFLHGSWPHVLMNSIAALAFGPPVARLMGLGARGVIAFFAFYLVCGAIAGAGFVALNPHDPTPLVGASGAISGLLGAASRIIEGRGRIGRMFGGTVIGMAVAWIIVNAVLGLTGLTPGATGPVAWQAHVIGYIAGVVLIGPFARLAGCSAEQFAS
jgi:membrane associated rhomboid family serine protease